MPTTNNCPYLPGQTINTLNIPMERSLRQRSASLNSMRPIDFKTINPEAKFITPRRPPPVPAELSMTRLASAPSQVREETAVRSSSPAPAWRRLFSRRSSSAVDSDRGRRHLVQENSEDYVERPTTSRGSSTSGRSRTSTLSDGTRSREISPEALRRFLVDDKSTVPDSRWGEKPSLVIPEDIAEENEDDQNFATSATAISPEGQPLATVLSPPPFKRSWSADTAPLTVSNLSSLTLATARPESESRRVGEAVSHASSTQLPNLDTSSTPSCFLSTSSSLMSPTSPQSPRDFPSFFDDSNDDDMSAYDGEIYSAQAVHVTGRSRETFDSYRLPRTSSSLKFSIHSPDVFPENESHESSMADSHLLGKPVDARLDAFADELRWMANTITTGKS